MKRHIATLALLSVMSPGLLAGVAPAAAAAENDVWASLKQKHFGDRPIARGAGVIGLDAPVRAEDAAIVPITIKDLLPADGKRRIDKMWLVIDNNPVPMSAIFDFTPLAGRAHIATRVRVDAYTTMRAIARTDDGKLYMASRFVKASGGCSAPASKDPDAAQGSLGEMRLKMGEQPASLGEIRDVQLMLRHPNHTGLQMNQLTRLYVPAHFVRKISVTYAGDPVLDMDTTFSLSEDPSLRFSFKPRAPGELSVRVVDNRQMRFAESLQIEPMTAQMTTP
ncbi:MAG: quinoprotein dehydrogenase-associated SoxYZ-like carrier [Gammaproteobacteria bacterium]|nr:quinoprotein dehydrogenase-associated SoxYZ-like carrier [Gammaproteobacteria bacterium]